MKNASIFDIQARNRSGKIERIPAGICKTIVRSEAAALNQAERAAKFWQNNPGIVSIIITESISYAHGNPRGGEILASFEVI